MVTNLLKSTESSLVQSKRTGYQNHKSLTFMITEIVDCLEIIIENIEVEKSAYSQCLTLEEYCQGLMIALQEEVRENKEDKTVDYDEILHLVFGTKIALSEIHFGESGKSDCELNRNKNEKLEAKLKKNLSILKKNVQKIRIASNCLTNS